MNTYLKTLLGIISLFTFSLVMSQSHAGQSNQYIPSKNIHWTTNFEEAAAASRSTSKPILILFTGTNWCGACKTLERDILSQPQFIEAVQSHFVFLKVELLDPSEKGMANSPHKALFQRYEVKFWPTMEIVEADGSRLFTLPYQPGNPAGYAKVLLAKLQQAKAGTN